ncbi:MAG: prolyl aminopeptidase [Myxococcales bacterium]|jgi:proline iminopeptidase
MNQPQPVRSLFAATEPYDTGTLKVDAPHELHYEQFGNPGGKPAVFVHGGPGGGTNRTQSRFWDPQKYRVVLFDQRGCGKSTPHASLEANTTWDLVGDLEKLRAHLGIERWQVFGGSWGSTLSLAYAQTHPEAVTELILRGIFLLRRREIEWFYQEGASRIFPDAWEHYLAPIPEGERADLIAAYHRRLTSDDRELQLQAARAWSIWEGSTSTLRPNPTMQNAMGREQFALAFARIECHYFQNRGFFERDGLLLEPERIARIRHIPTIAVQGRYDVVCPPESAWDLHNAWPEMRLIIAGTAGHSAFEPEILHHLVTATEEFASR